MRGVNTREGMQEQTQAAVMRAGGKDNKRRDKQFHLPGASVRLPGEALDSMKWH